MEHGIRMKLSGTLAVLTLFTAAALGDHSNTVYVSLGFPDTSPRVEETLTSVGRAELSLWDVRYEFPGHYFQASATSNYTFIAMHEIVDGGLAGDSQAAHCSAAARDGLTIHSPGLPDGEVVTLTYRIAVQGVLDVRQGVSFASWLLEARVGPLDPPTSQVLRRGGTFISPIHGNAGYHGDAFGTYSDSVSIILGEPVSIAIDVSAVASESGAKIPYGDARCDIDAVTWEGFSVTRGGEALEFTVTSESGTNWKYPNPICRGDFNNDGDPATMQDITDFFACLAGSCCPTCPVNADFNGDGDVGTDADIEAFFRVLAGGNC